MYLGPSGCVAARPNLRAVYLRGTFLLLIFCHLSSRFCCPQLSASRSPLRVRLGPESLRQGYRPECLFRVLIIAAAVATAGRTCSSRPAGKSHGHVPTPSVATAYVFGFYLPRTEYTCCGIHSALLG